MADGRGGRGRDNDSDDRKKTMSQEEQKLRENLAPYYVVGEVLVLFRFGALCRIIWKQDLRGPVLSFLWMNLAQYPSSLSVFGKIPWSGCMNCDPPIPPLYGCPAKRLARPVVPSWIKHQPVGPRRDGRRTPRRYFPTHHLRKPPFPPT